MDAMVDERVRLQSPRGRSRTRAHAAGSVRFPGALSIARVVQAALRSIVDGGNASAVTTWRQDARDRFGATGRPPLRRRDLARPALFLVGEAGVPALRRIPDRDGGAREAAARGKETPRILDASIRRCDFADELSG